MRFKETKNGELVQRKPLLFLRYLYLIKIINLKKEWKEINKEIQNQQTLTTLFKNCIKELRKSYPKTKFVIVKFQVFEDESKFFNPELEKILTDNGVIILDAEKLTGEKFYLPEYKIQEEIGYNHPNAEVWEKLTPEIVKALNL